MSRVEGPVFRRLDSYIDASSRTSKTDCHSPNISQIKLPQIHVWRAPQKLDEQLLSFSEGGFIIQKVTDIRNLGGRLESTNRQK